MSNFVECVFCAKLSSFRPRTGDSLTMTCPRCGSYTIVGTAESLLRDKRVEHPGAVSGWIRHQNRMGITPRISGDQVDRLRALTRPPFRKRVERFLIAAAEKVPRLNECFDPGADQFIGISYSDDLEELEVILEYLRQEGLMAAQHQMSEYRQRRDIFLPMTCAQEGLRLRKRSSRCGSRTK
jgi:hypothetical protein